MISESAQPAQAAVSAPTLVVRIAAVALATGAVAGQLAYLDAVSVGLLGLPGADVPRSLLAALAAHAGLAAVSAGLAVTLAFRADVGSPGARGLSVAVGAWGYLLAYPGLVLLLRPDPGAARFAFDAHFLLVEAAGLAGLVRFTTLFPRRLDRDDIVSATGSSPWSGLIRAIWSRTLEPAPVWGAALIVPLLIFAAGALAGHPVGSAGLSPAMEVLRVAAAALVVLDLRVSWTHAEAGDRNRLAWMVVALALLVGSVTLVIAANILMAATGWPDLPFAWRPVLLDLGAAGFVGGLAAAQLAGPATDAVRLARRIVATGGLVTASLLLATVLEVLLSSGLVGSVSIPHGPGTVLAIATAGSVGPRLLRLLERSMQPWSVEETAG